VDLAGGSGGSRDRRLCHDQRVNLLLATVDAEFFAIVGIVWQPGLLGQFRVLWKPGNAGEHQPVIGPEWLVRQQVPQR
jgi:hypothetical protein